MARRNLLRIDPKVVNHPVVTRLSDEAFRAQLRAMAYLAEYDVTVLPQAVGESIATPELAEELVHADVWHPAGTAKGQGWWVAPWNASPVVIPEQAVADGE